MDQEVDLETFAKIFTREEALEASLAYFKGDTLAADAWINKYALKDSEGNLYESNPTQMHERLAYEIFRAESKYKNPMSQSEIFEVLDGFKHIIPQGGPMSGIGNNHQYVSLSNCFVIGNDGPSDSYGAILRTDEEQVQLMKRRGGVGHDLSSIRPAGSNVNNSALTSTGVVPFMERYSNSTREVAQDGRRGALMLSIHIQHPDSESFIDAKLEEGKVTGANVSVRIPDSFMEAVMNGEEYTHQYPISDFLTEEEDPQLTVQKNAKQLWDKIIHNAWKSAEPGIMFWDQIIRESLPDRYADLGFRTISTNPCIVGSTLIATADGRNAVSIEQLTNEGKDIPVYSTNPNTGRVEIKYGRNPRKTGDKKEVWKLKLDDGSELIATPDHKILTKDLRYIELKDLKPDDSIYPFYSFNSNGYRQISNIGKKMSDGRFANRRQYREIYNFFNDSVDPKLYAIHHVDFDNKNDSPENLIKMLHEEHIRLHADKMKGKNNPYHKQSDNWKKSFASHPGKTNGRYSGYTNDQILDHGRKVFETNGKLTKKLWSDYAKSNGLPQTLNSDFRFGTFTNFKNQVSTNHKVTSVEFYGYEDVYNITVDDNHNYHVITSSIDNQYITSSGICVKNCGEIPLCPDDSCRLLAIVLYSYVDNPFTENATFNWKKFKKHARMGTRMMDDIIDLELEKIDKIIDKIENDPENIETKHTELQLWKRIRKKCINGRRTGIGVTAEGDMLAALNLKYGTPEATEFAEEVHRVYALEVYRESCNLAQERGAFPLWDSEREAGAPMLERIKEHDQDLYEDLMTFGRRNIALLTIAPTGTVSLMAQTSSGIEPAFLISYKRRRKINPNDKDAKVDFIDEVGDHWEEYNVFHHKFVDWYVAQNDDHTAEELESMPDEPLQQLISESPWHGATANDVDWVEKVRMQGKIQKWVDHSISVTVNLPEDVDEELVNQVYLTAWQSGCKGCTIYRDGSRSGVLISNDAKIEEDFSENHAPKRPKSLECVVTKFTNKGEKWIGFIGLYKGRPYEIFTGKLDDFPIPNYVEDGYIIRSKKDGVSNYSFTYVDKLGQDITIPSLNHAFDERYYDMAKTISAILRHGMPLQYVLQLLDGLTLDGELISTWKAGVKRMIKRFIADGTKVEDQVPEDCPQPEAKSCELVYEEGCLNCKTCGKAKCG